MRKGLKSLVLLAIAIGGLGTCLFFANRPSRPRRALPATARDVQEFIRESGNGDYSACLKARMTLAEYEVFSDKLNLDLRHAHGAPEPGKISLDTMPALFPEWFDAPKASVAERVRYFSGTSSVIIAKYQDGWVYLTGLRW